MERGKVFYSFRWRAGSGCFEWEVGRGLRCGEVKGEREREIHHCPFLRDLFGLSGGQRGGLFMPLATVEFFKRDIF